MRKETNKILISLTLSLFILFTINCKKDNSNDNKGIGKYAGNWFESQYINEFSGENIKYTIDNNTKPAFVIKSDGSITFNNGGTVIKDIIQDSETVYSYNDSYNILEFKSDIECVETTISEETGDSWTTIYIKR